LDEVIKFSWTDKSDLVVGIKENHDLFYNDKDWNNILMKFVSDWDFLAVKYLVWFPFDYFHKNNDWYDVFDFIRIFASDNQKNEIYKSNVRKCGEFISEKLVSENSLSYLSMIIEQSKNFHQYQELYEKFIISGNINELTPFGSNLLHKAATFWDVAVVKILLDCWIDSEHLNWKWETALFIAKAFTVHKPWDKDYEVIVQLLSAKINL
jgi:hypothetical protein